MAFVAPILICYDGSDGARAALETAALTFDRPMVVACYWQSFAETQKPMGIDLLEVVQDPASINDREQALAERYAHEGRDLVEAAGRTADGVAIKVTTPIDDAILSHADELDAHAIVLGSRSRSGLGSISARRRRRRRGGALQPARVRGAVDHAGGAPKGRSHPPLGAL